MKQTEEQYANELIERYQLYALTEYNAIHCAIKDVENTIEALSELDNHMVLVTYYQNVLQILKDKL